LKDVRHWQAINSMRRANIFGIRNAPEGFVAWARTKRVIEINSD